MLYRFEARDWTPRRDFVVTLYDWPAQRVDELVRVREDEARLLPCPDLIELQHDSQGLAGLDESTLALCRNLPYARHGFPFRRADLREALYRDFAIVRTPPPADTSPADPPRRDWLRIGAPNPFYSDALLDEQDRAYLAAIAAAQARHQGAVTGPH